MDNQLKNFVEKFFINLGAQVILQGDYILVSNVPESFEKFYGKNSPYKFVFSSQKMSSDSSLVEKGSYTLKAISNYLENSGETTLLKINFECDGENEIRKRIKISNSKIKKFLPKKKYSIFFRFTFHTTYQYLNKKKKIINEIYVHEGKIINGNLKDYPVSEGKRNEIRIPDIKESYFIAKEELKNKLVEETEKFKEKLSGKLNREIERIEKHFSNEEEEIEINLKKAEEKLEELLIEADSSKISRQKSLIKNLKEKLNIEEKTREKNQAILIEKNRYGLNVNNKLFNTTLIYHPIFSYDVELKNNSSNKKIEISFNPLTQEISLPKCESCQEEIDEIYLC